MFAVPYYVFSPAQVSSQRKRRFYVYVARRLFAAKPEVNQVAITALGSAVASAIATADDLEKMSVGTIVNVSTSYNPIVAGDPRNVARIVITVERNPEWQPEESDFQKPPRVGQKKSDGEVKAEPAAIEA